MISKDFYEVLLKSDISFFTGVPDSLLKSILAYITDNTSEENEVEVKSLHDLKEEFVEANASQDTEDLH